MASVTVDSSTYEKLRFSAALMGCSPGEVVAMLVSRLDQEAPRSNVPEARHTPAAQRARMAPQASTPPEQSSVVRETKWIPVYRVFKGQTFEAEFNPASLEVRITSAPWSGKVFSSPTAAAEAVVSHVPGKRETVNTNGRKFWRLRSGDGDLRTVVGQRF
ncbi:hypothetical protein ACXR8F_20705 [Terrabacter sp. AAH1]